MKLVETGYDEKTDEYIYTLEMSEDEERTLTAYCNENGITIQDFVTQALTKIVQNPDELREAFKSASTKLPKGKKGKPVLEKEDSVGFEFIKKDGEEPTFLIGKVYIVDANGTYETGDEPSYDVMVKNYNDDGDMLFKHLPESELYKLPTE